MNKKIGLFFGSFNPPHVGHFALANYILNEGPVEEIWFVVSPQNPLKSPAQLAPARTRLEMVRRAIGDFMFFKPCDIEFYLQPPHYTIFTLLHLEEKFPEHEFFLLIGMDNLQTFTRWKAYRTILDHYHLLVYPRKGYDGGKLLKESHVHVVAAPLIEISSSYIRQLIKERKEFRFFVPETVYQMIVEENLYLS
jgi:nicotinate-nucleotide adenylyltransferase